MPAELKETIEKSLASIGEVEAYKKPHRKGAGPVQPRCLPEDTLVHEKAEEIRKGQASRIHFKCSNPACGEELIRVELRSRRRKQL